MPGVDLDFARYIAMRRGAVARRARDGAPYAYAGDHRLTRSLGAIRPITLALEATVRLWKTMARAELLGSCVKVTDQQFPQLHALAAHAADTLEIPVPALYVAPALGALNAYTLGTEDDAVIVVNAALVDHLEERELSFVIGHECGHIANNHVVLSTALYYLTRAASFYVRWIVEPATLGLKAWSRRAEITCDRAGLLCCRDLDVATAALVKLALGSQKLYERLDVDEYLKQLEENRRSAGRVGEYFRSHPYLPKRIEALRLFARSSYYRRASGLGEDGLPADETDAEVARLVGVL